MNNTVISSKAASQPQPISSKRKTPYDFLPLVMPKAVLDGDGVQQTLKKMSNIDKNQLISIAQELNATPKGAIVSNELVKDAINGLALGDQSPDFKNHNSPVFKNIDSVITDSIKKLYALSAASALINPDSMTNPHDSLAGEVLPVLQPQHNHVMKFLKDDAQITQFIQKELPPQAQSIFAHNQSIMKQAPITEKGLNEIVPRLKKAPESVQKAINEKLEKNFTNILKLSNLRFLATVGSASTGVPALAPIAPMQTVS